MPCPWSRRARAAAATELPAPTASKDVEDWKTVRRSNIRHMRKQTKTIMLLMALMEALRVGPLQMVYAGTDNFPPKSADDYGIAYTVGYIISYIYLCIFMVIFVPLFSWWIPSTKSSTTPTLLTRIATTLKQINMLLLPFTIGLCLANHIAYTLQTLVYVDSRVKNSWKLPKNNRKNWATRFLLLGSIALVMGLGYGAFQILDMVKLAKVKDIEYLIIVVPIQVNLGVLLGSGIQWKVERRAEMKKRVELEAAKNATAVVDEKQALLSA